MNAPIQAAEIARIAEQLAVICDDDEQLFHDMIIGETDIDRIVSRIHAQIARDEEMLVGITVRQGDLAERKRRISDRITAQKAAVGKFLRAGQLTKLELPEVTYSVRDGKPKLEIKDEGAVPEEFCAAVLKPVKAKINEAYAEAGTLPNWLTRIPATDIVTARTR